VDSFNNLWLFGGYGVDETGNSGYLNDLWKYDMSTNEWTWMKGSSLRTAAANWGTKKVSAPTNDPGSRQPYPKWKDSQGNFWLFGGWNAGSVYNDLWRYSPATNEWT